MPNYKVHNEKTQLGQKWNNKYNNRQQTNKAKLGSKQAMRKKESNTTKIRGKCC